MSTLKIWCWYSDIDYKTISAQMYDLLASINPSAFPLLNHLTFETMKILGNFDLDIPILGQLNEFNFKTEGANDAGLLIHLLEKYANLNELKLHKIGLGNRFDKKQLLQHATQLKCANKFINIGNYYTVSRLFEKYSAKELAQLCNHFCSLTTVSWTVGFLPLNTVINQQASLKQLVHLELVLDFAQNPLRIDSPTVISSIASVKILNLNFIGLISANSNALNLPVLFPNLCRLYLYIAQCACCRVNDSYRKLKRCSECVRLHLAPLLESYFQSGTPVPNSIFTQFNGQSKEDETKLEGIMFSDGGALVNVVRVYRVANIFLNNLYYDYFYAHL